MRECKECNGVGKIEVMNCNNQSSECCGGCTKEVECEECGGLGTFNYWNYIEEDFSEMIENWDLTKQELKYLIDNTNF